MTAEENSTLYHLAPVPRWSAAFEKGEDYYPETYQVDGFTHLTADPSFLLVVGNSFYKGSKDEWVLLELDAAKLGTVKFEPAAPVGETQPSDELKARHRGGGEEGKESPSPVLFPHLYAGIPTKGAVIKERKVTRGEDGSFLSIEGM